MVILSIPCPSSDVVYYTSRIVTGMTELFGFRADRRTNISVTFRMEVELLRLLLRQVVAKDTHSQAAETVDVADQGPAAYLHYR